QCSALPLSYGSMPGDLTESAKRPYTAGRSLPQGLKRRKRSGAVKNPAANQRLAIAFCFNWAVAPHRFPFGSPCLARRSWSILLAWSFEHSSRSTMMDEKDEGRGSAPAKDSRRDRLKLALRENLKRRKAQAKQRSGRAANSRGQDASHDFGAKRPDK